ncbi:glucans biosynthesis glucosyltransferase MdoH [Bowmanella sp. Y26]|uniref:glucans biosynthesis glucosyltransferase MdoH n=1 Tax=Bowmanella yangjiangensis TaxID=2811230 RepID=UPI001BDC446B|nr:glucans biosynthesis glucosyltransferase MdoH [Bowmanella yangjiangensis]MBT1064498.1 glucans biosynthesis glucosyltransferase MdoH [Bowmanella yangjiangensis]
MSGIQLTSSKSEAPKAANSSAPWQILLNHKALRQWLFFLLVSTSAVAGISMMTHILKANGLTGLETTLLVLFAIVFSWIVCAFWSAVIGFALQWLRIDPLSLKRSLALPEDSGAPMQRTAVVMPVYNEDTRRIMAGFETCLRQLAQTGHLAQFDMYMLSDTRNVDMAQAELDHWHAMQQRLGELGKHAFYRRREKNTERKVGNLKEFCQRFGYRYEHMIVLDADSVMSGQAMLQLVHSMEQNPKVGLIQTVPIPVRQTTLFGRFLQFASELYCPMLATGLSFWQTDSANYWGHNAIIRMDAFMQHCGLPRLNGPAPFGGDILSHDFVEAALLRRAGWDVFLLTEVRGSFEEVPCNILDYATRDRRWVQGNIQHLGLLTGSGLHLTNRLHFLFGALAYISSLLWMLMLSLSSADALIRATTDNDYFTQTYQLFPNWQVAETGLINALLMCTVVLLMFPKVLGVLLALKQRRAEFGGARALLSGALAEALFALLIAPLMMVYHAFFVLSVFLGYQVSWNAQEREGRMLSWHEAFKRTALASAIAVVWAVVTYLFAPLMFWWMVPVFTGVILAAPIVRYSSSLELGRWARLHGLFISPSEAMEPSELKQLRLRLANMPQQPAQIAFTPILPTEQWRDMPVQSFDTADTPEVLVSVNR